MSKKHRSKNKGSKNHNTLPTQTLAKVVSSIEDGLRVIDIMAKHDVSRSTVMRLKNGSHYYYSEVSNGQTE